MDVKFSFADKEITPLKGDGFYEKMLDKTGLLTELVSSNLLTQQSNMGYSPKQLITCLLVSIWCGANKFEH